VCDEWCWTGCWPEGGSIAIIFFKIPDSRKK